MDRKAGFIGTGEIASIHAEAVGRMGSGIKIAGGYDVSGAASRNFCSSYGGKVYQSVDSLIGDRAIDVVYICTRHDSHMVLSMAALEAGKSIFLEKPLAMNSKEAMSLLEKYRKKPVPMAVGFNMRVSPATMRLKELLREYGVKAESFRASMTAAPFINGWASDPKTGGGVLVCLGSHMFDLITHLLGSHVKRICAAIQHIDQPFSKEGDSATILLQLENGVCGTLLIHDRGSREFHVEPGGGMTNITIYSPQGTFDVDVYGRLRLGTRKGLIEEIPAGGRDMCHNWGYERENIEFYRLLDGETTELCTMEQAARVVSVVDAARDSDAGKCWIELRALKAIMHDFEARDFSIVQGGGGSNNCFIATDDNTAISENNRFKNGRLLL